MRAQVESRLREAHQSNTRFMSATSHDLLQPINAARLFTAALKPKLEGGVEGQTLRIVDQIDSSLNRAEQLIAELREIARLDSGKQMPRRTHFPVATLFESLAQEFLPVARTKNLELRVMRSSAWLYSDQSLVHRVLQNLLGNALKYTERGTVLLGVRRRAAGAELQVWDTGPGIAEQDQVKVFQEFERLQRQPAGADDGLGLGLAIVQRYGELLGHPVKLKSVQGAGTLFSVTVTYGQEQSSRQPLQEEAAGRDLEGIRVICLENDPLVLEGMLQLLQTMGAVVSAVADREQLLALCKDGLRPDIVLADYHLDDGDTGLNAVQGLRKHTGLETPCIIISADDSDVIRDRAKAVGYRFQPKPVNATRLRALVLALTRAG